jgi:long-chain fatty acid transport protein
VGAGLNAMFGYLDTDIAVNRVIQPDGQMSLKDDTWGFGANVGLLFKAGDKTRIGVNYLSPVDLDFADTPSFSNVVPNNPRTLDLGMKVPQSAMLSVVHALNDEWSVMADFGWQDWSQFGYVQAGFEGGDATTLNLQYQDTYHGALGAQYKASDKLVLTGGAAFDSSSVESANRTVTLPMGQAWRFGVGAQYQISETVNVGAAYTFLWAGDMSVDQGTDASLRGRVAGTYQDAWFNFINVNLTWKF